MIQKRLFQLETKLFESLSNARKLYSTKIEPKEFEELVKLDPSKTFKYIEKICKFYLELGGSRRVNLEGLKYQIDTFNNLAQRNLIDKKDINSFKTYWDFEEYLSNNSNKMSKSEEKELIKNNGTKVVLNNKNLLVLLIKNEQASIQYGSGTKWCISAKDSENYFKRYRLDKEVTFYFIFQKNLPSSNPLYKIAVAVYPDRKLEVYDSTDLRIPFSVVSDLGLKDSLFRPSGLSNLDLVSIIVIGEFEILKNEFIKVNGDVRFFPLKEKIYNIKTEIGQFEKVSGYFDVSNQDLKTLEGSPEEVGDSFLCNINHLFSLEYSPIYVKKDFVCSNNNLSSLKYSPKYVGGNFYCMGNRRDFSEEYVRSICDVGGRIFNLT